MAVVASEDGDIVMQDPLSQESGIVTEAGDELIEQEEAEHIVGTLKLEDVPITKASHTGDPKLQKDMETCFGFDEVSLIFSYHMILILKLKIYISMTSMQLTCFKASIFILKYN